MKIVVIGGTGLIGRRLVDRLREQGHEAVAASPATGVDAVTGAGLAEALAGARVVVDVANAPSFEAAAVMEFFERSGRNLLAEEAVAGVAHHVALSVVNADRMTDSGYMRAKVVQEELIKAAGVPYTILRATQFFEFLAAIAASSVHGDTIRLSPALIQPVAADDVAATLADLALDTPLEGTLDLAGPEAIALDDTVRRLLATTGDPRQVTTDPDAGYFGIPLDDQTLTPTGTHRTGKLTYIEWLTRHPH